MKQANIKHEECLKKLFENLEYFEKLEVCPWCSRESAKNLLWCEDEGAFETVQCVHCGMVFCMNRLNYRGREEYYKQYYNNVHQLEDNLVSKRDEMYQNEIDFIEAHINGGRVLDVGCSGGEFLTCFNENKWSCWGIEFGSEAVQAAQEKIGSNILHGELPEFKEVLFEQKFDLIVFRGVIEHVPYPKTYLETALKILAPKGKIFIGSTPNRDSLCADLFRNNWNQHCPEAHIFHFSPFDFKNFFHENSLQLIGERFFYLETPYAEIDNDLQLIEKAIKLRSQGEKIDFKSPPFWGNLMTLMFEKQ